ncbi:MAG: hypothetical protein M1546_19010 [Chloroflexi bacterium]|nr:hypothetical protein [Chloroflexota bacterium]
MSKSKKARTPQIDPRVLTRPRLDALFVRHERAELDDDGLYAGVQSLIAELGERPVLDALVKRMEDTPEVERGVLMMIVARLKSSPVIEYLWRQVKTPRALSLEAKLTALAVLKGMGEDVDLSDPTRYFSPRELKPSNIASAEKLFRMGWRALARPLRELRDAAEVEAYMHKISQVSENAADGEDLFLGMVAEAEHNATDLEADFLLALVHTSSSPEVQHAAGQALEHLAERGVRPVTPVILGLGQDRFHAAYMSDPNHPWQQSVIVAWERSGGAIQALVFLLDFGMPWRGAIKDLFLTTGLTAAEFQRDLIEKQRRGFGEEEIGLYRVSLARAQATIAAAVEANRRHHIPLPKDFTEFNHLLERWVLHPPVSSIESDTTQDELGEFAM